MRVLSVLSSKGGVGKTVTSLSLAVTLAAQGCKTLLVDADGSATASSFFRSFDELPDGSDGCCGIYDVLFHECRAVDAAREVRLNLALLASDPRMMKVDAALLRQPAADLLLARALRNVAAGEFEYAIVDTPGVWGGMVQNAVLASSHLIVPVNSEQMAYDIAVDTLSYVLNQMDAYERPCPQFRVLLTAYRETNACRDIAELALQTWPQNLFETRVRFTEEVKRLSADRKTIGDRKSATLREDYNNTAKEIISWLTTPTAQTRKPRRVAVKTGKPKTGKPKTGKTRTKAIGVTAA